VLCVPEEAFYDNFDQLIDEFLMRFLRKSYWDRIVRLQLMKYKDKHRIIHRGFYLGEKAPSAALTLVRSQKESISHIKDSRFIELKPESI
jgi:hypothetical protein